MRKILIVDDELSIVNFTSDVARVTGFESKFLTNGTNVMETAKKWKPDVITLDLMIPSPSGLEVLDQLKDNPETEHIPVYIMTAAKITPEIQERLKRAQAIFIKPIDTKDFIRHLRNLDNPLKESSLQL